MKVSYDAIKRMIEEVFEEMSAADQNVMLDKYQAAKPDQQTTKDYCMKLVAPEIRTGFIKQLDTLEKASKGKLDKAVKEGRTTQGGSPGKLVGTKKIKVKVRARSALYTEEKNRKSKKLNKKTLIRIINDVLEEEELSRGEITKRREDLFPGWKQNRQLAAGIVEKKKEKKKNCVPGAVYHDADGEFSSKQDAKVYSLKFAGKGKSGCKRGQAKVSNGKELFTRLPCGRGDESGTYKAKYKCKDGEPASE